MSGGQFPFKYFESKVKNENINKYLTLAHSFAQNDTQDIFISESFLLILSMYF